MEPGIGNHNHTHHSPLNQHSQGKTKSCIDDDDEIFINNMANAQILNIVFNKTGKLIPRYTIQQITKYKKEQSSMNLILKKCSINKRMMT